MSTARSKSEPAVSTSSIAPTLRHTDIVRQTVQVFAAVESPWVWEARPDVWLLVACLAGGYWWSMTRLRIAFNAPPSPRSQVVRYGLGVAVLWLAVDWPMDRIGDDFLFSAHVVQFLMITLIASPLLLTGVPGWLQSEIIRPVQPLVGVLTRAPVALALFQMVIVGTHLPFVVELYASNSVVHFGLHALWLLSALVFWMPILGSEPVARLLRPPLKVAYLIGATVVPTVPASFLTWAETAFYTPYATAPRVWGLSPVEDLQLAGALMKLGGGTILWGYILWVFASWASSERSPHRADLR